MEIIGWIVWSCFGVIGVWGSVKCAVDGYRHNEELRELGEQRKNEIMLVARTRPGPSPTMKGPTP